VGPRVLIIEDHELLAQSLGFALRTDGLDVHVIPAVDDDVILERAKELRPEIVLLDLDLGEPLGTSLPLIEPLGALGARVVMLTGLKDRVRLAECVEAGAVGLLSKNQSFESLVEAVSEAATMHSLITDAQREELLDELRRQRASDRRRLEPFERLTQRERQVLAKLMDGQSAEAIARDWVVSLATVRSQIRSVLTKLDVNSQLAAVAVARRAGWRADPDDAGQ
jgi:DNA-binding NarL/FixJ family response regulator